MVSIPAGLALVAAGETASARASTAIYAACLAALLGTSASYHRYPWSARAMTRMQRLDHSMIFLLIAGTYTPVTVLALRGSMRVAILAIVWAGAALGISLKLVRWKDARLVAAALYIGLGWVAVVATPQFLRRLPAGASILLATGGLLYTVGAVILLRRRPDPFPAVFGYHEIWHAMVTGAIACHYVAILLLELGS
jgi:hemolysin III